MTPNNLKKYTNKVFLIAIGLLSLNLYEIKYQNEE